VIAPPATTPLTAPATTPPTGPPVLTTSGTFFALSVADVEKSAKWYTDKLGLSVAMRAPKTNKMAVVLLGGGGLIVELVQHADSKPLSQIAPSMKETVLIQGIFKVGVVVDDFDKTLAALRERKVEIAFGPYLASGEQSANVIIRDNGGNLIQIFGKGRG
jgi:catechol 2,3-dioxygenase-like lactoylglutathione lyase family enzyme